MEQVSDERTSSRRIEMEEGFEKLSENMDYR